MRNSLDGAIGASPASTVDLDAIVAAGRRRTRLRRLILVSPVVGSAAAVVAIVALTMSTVGQSPTPNAPLVVQPAVPSSAASGAAPVHAGETPEQASQRLAAALADALAAAQPGVQFSDLYTGEAVAGFQVWSGPGQPYNAGISLRTAVGEGDLAFVSYPGGVLPRDTPPSDWSSDSPAPPIATTWWPEDCADLTENPWLMAANNPAECDESIGPDGQTIVLVTVLGDDQTVTYDAYVTWTNARVELRVMNGLKCCGPLPAVAPPLTPEQLIAIAIDPALAVGA